MNTAVKLFEAVSIKDLLTIKKIPLSSNLLLVISCLIISTLYNQALWSHLFTRIGDLNFASMGFCIALFCWMFTLLLALIMVFSHPIILKYTLALAFAVCGLIAYFNHIGVIIDENMITNILLTDATESIELLNSNLIISLLIMVGIPWIILANVKIQQESQSKILKDRVLLLLGSVIITALISYLDLQYITYFSRENRDLRALLNPHFPALSVRSYIKSRTFVEPEFKVLGKDASVVPHTHKSRTIGIVVVGETARADHFSINGYDRKTSPMMEKRNLFNFTNVTSCGTSTAYSVPCMFSFFGSKNYNPQKANYQSNLLDVLETINIKTLWRDNNSTCKGVCNRIETENLRTQNADPSSIYYNDGEYLDEILLSNLAERIKNTQSDMLIVLHQLGSHGPAYHKRFPKEFSLFTPNCDSNAPHNCTVEEVNNSYDNTIAYTDHFLEKTIELLEKLDPEDHTFMLYASDHGESLGENGIYLHGVPKAMAPKEQTHVPMMLWLSDSLQSSRPMETSNISNCKNEPLSHDNIVHSLLSLYQVKTQLMDQTKNILNMNCMDNIASSDTVPPSKS